MKQKEIQQAFVQACSPRNLLHFDQEDEPSSCLSTERHDDTVEDAVQHYFGCIKISERAEFLSKDHPHWRHERGVQREKYQLELSQMKAKYLSNTDQSNSSESNTNESNTDNSTSDKSKWRSYLRGIQENIEQAGHIVPVDVVATLDSLSDQQVDLLLQKLVDARADVWLEKRMGTVAIAIEAQYKRIQVLRNALNKTRVTLPASGSQDILSGMEDPAKALKSALDYLRQWIQWDKSCEQKHKKFSQRQKACKRWRFDQSHERILIEHIFQINKVPEVDMIAFYQYIPYLKGFVRSRLWELAQDTQKMDLELGATGSSANNRVHTGNDESQRQYGTEVARFLGDQKRQPAQSPKERSFDKIVELYGINFNEHFKKRSNKRVRAEQVLEILADSELTVVKTLEDSRRAWIESDRYREGIELVRKWKAGKKEIQPHPTENDRNYDGAVSQSSTNTDANPPCIPTSLPQNSENDQESDLSATTIHADEPGRKEVRALARKQRTKKNGPKKTQDTSHGSDEGATANTDDNYGEYELEKDVNAYLIQFKIKQEADKNSRHPETFLEQHEEPLTDGRFKGTFPDQRMSVSLLLSSDVSEASKTKAGNIHEGKSRDGEQIERNILSRNQCKTQDGSQKIRYFHIPSNNMEVRI